MVSESTFYSAVRKGWRSKIVKIKALKLLGFYLVLDIGGESLPLFRLNTGDVTQTPCS